MFEGSEYAYYAMYLIGFIIMMVLNIHDHKRYKIKKTGDAVWITCCTYVFGVVGAIMMGKIYTAVARHFGSTETSNVAIFGAVVFTPLLVMLTVKLQRDDVKRNLDLVTVGILIILICAKFGCFLSGCCAGFPWKYGIYNPRFEMKMFPVQICEVVTMLAVLFVTQRFIRNSKKFIPGTAYPITFGLYCVTRFLWEFARYYPTPEMKHIFLGLSFWQLWCILVFTVSAVSIYSIYKKQPQNKRKKTSA